MCIANSYYDPVSFFFFNSYHKSKFYINSDFYTETKINTIYLHGHLHGHVRLINAVI